MSDEELAAIAAGAPGPSSQQDVATTEDGDLASIMSLLLGGEDQANPAQSQEQVDFENQLAILELLQAEQGNQQEVPQLDLRQGSNYNPIDGGNEIAASTMYTRNNLASIADQQARQRNRADAMWQMQNQPVAAAPQRAGLSELLAQASSLYDLLKRKPAAEAAAPPAATTPPAPVATPPPSGGFTPNQGGWSVANEPTATQGTQNYVRQLRENAQMQQAESGNPILEILKRIKIGSPGVGIRL